MKSVCCTSLSHFLRKFNSLSLVKQKKNYRYTCVWQAAELNRVTQSFEYFQSHIIQREQYTVCFISFRRSHSFIRCNWYVDTVELHTGMPYMRQHFTHLGSLQILRCFRGTTENLCNYKVRQQKGRATPLQPWTDPEGSSRLRLTDFKAICTWRW